MTTQTSRDFASLDPLFGPLLSFALGSDGAVLLAVLVKGIANGVPTDDIRLWIKHRGVDTAVRAGGNHSESRQEHNAQSGTPSSSATATRSAPPLSELVGNQQLWDRLCRAAEVKVLSSPSLSGDVRGSHLSTAKKLYAGLLLPTPVDDLLFTKSLNIRVALAGVALTLLSDERGWDTAVVTQPRLAVSFGWNRVTAAKSLTLLSEMNMLTRTRAGKGVNGRYRMPALRSDRSAAIGQFARSLSALAEGRSDPIADLIRSVSHPAWGYSNTIDHRHWLLLLSQASGVPASTFKMRSPIQRRLEATALEVGLTSFAIANGLNEILDRIADDPRYGEVDPETGDRETARSSHATAMARYRQAAHARGEASIRHKRLKANAYVALDELLTQNRLPQPPHLGNVRTAERRSANVLVWLSSMRSAVIAASPNADFKSVGGNALLDKMVGRGYGPKFASAAVRYIMHGEELSAARDESNAQT